jgi:hypothetical protein
MQIKYAPNAFDAPSSRVRELYGGNDDINAGFGGKLVSTIESV